MTYLKDTWKPLALHSLWYSWTRRSMISCSNFPYELFTPSSWGTWCFSFREATEADSDWAVFEFPYAFGRTYWKSRKKKRSASVVTANQYQCKLGTNSWSLENEFSELMDGYLHRLPTLRRCSQTWLSLCHCWMKEIWDSYITGQFLKFNVPRPSFSCFSLSMWFFSSSSDNYFIRIPRW